MNKIPFRGILISFILLFITFNLSSQETGIQLYTKNSYFWEYNGQPVLLIGGSSNDNLFQNINIVEELNQLQAVGGNYVRCTLSGRDVGDEWPFWRLSRRFILNKFNPEFWKNLDSFFKLTAERKIFVQVEIWAFHDFMEGWERNPWNPALNNVFSELNTNLKTESYGDTGTAKHDFFFSVPKLKNDSLLLDYQKMFVDHLLGISLKYNHILYCITNEIYSQYSPEWGWFWADYINQKALEEGVSVHITEMFQTPDIMDKQHYASLQHPELYSYIDISQNSRKVGQEHWEKLQIVRTATESNPRPLNNVKIYGGPRGEWTDGPAHGINRFWRNLVGGAASVRFHSSPSGIGISERAQFHIKSATMLAAEYDFFTSQPNADFNLFDERGEDEAYLATNSRGDAIVYFPDGGQVVIDFTDFEGDYELKWLNVEGKNWYKISNVEGGQILELKSPHAGGWIALLKRK